MNTLLLLGLVAGYSSDPDADAIAALALATAVQTHSQPAPAAVEPVAGYPSHVRRWTYPGEIHAHLKSGQHAGKWPSSWIDGLTRQQAESLHDDDHEGKVQWEYVPGHKTAEATPVVPFRLPSYTLGVDPNCPTGH